MVPHQETHQRVMLSAGVHGNETAPIEILCRHVDQLLSGNMPLGVRLLVILGNIGAMREGKRYSRG
ncbi:succinylglutamate desuccinylase/aspartoacylase family protein [Vibrio sp. PP-XX7]